MPPAGGVVGGRGEGYDDFLAYGYPAAPGPLDYSYGRMPPGQVPQRGMPLGMGGGPGAAGGAGGRGMGQDPYSRERVLGIHGRAPYPAEYGDAQYAPAGPRPDMQQVPGASGAPYDPHRGGGYAMPDGGAGGYADMMARSRPGGASGAGPYRRAEAGAGGAYDQAPEYQPQGQYGAYQAGLRGPNAATVSATSDPSNYPRAETSALGSADVPPFYPGQSRYYDESLQHSLQSGVVAASSPAVTSLQPPREGAGQTPGDPLSPSHPQPWQLAPGGLRETSREAFRRGTGSEEESSHEGGHSSAFSMSSPGDASQELAPMGSFERHESWQRDMDSRAHSNESLGSQTAGVASGGVGGGLVGTFSMTSRSDVAVLNADMKKIIEQTTASVVPNSMALKAQGSSIMNSGGAGYGSTSLGEGPSPKELQGHSDSSTQQIEGMLQMLSMNEQGQNKEV